jgi:hypothetical protein
MALRASGGPGGSGSVAHGEVVVVVLELGGVDYDARPVERILMVWSCRRSCTAGEASCDGELR